eukprot:78196_1
MDKVMRDIQNIYYWKGEVKNIEVKKNKQFNYEEKDWIIFKIKHSGFVRSYLPKAVIIRNDPDTTGVKECVISIGDDGNGKEWFKYKSIRIEKNNNYQQIPLTGVDWKLLKHMKYQFIKLEFIKNYGEARNEQCRFKLEEFRVYGLEFKCMV